MGFIVSMVVMVFMVSVAVNGCFMVALLFLYGFFVVSMLVSLGFSCVS